MRSRYLYVAVRTKGRRLFRNMQVICCSLERIKLCIAYEYAKWGALKFRFVRRTGLVSRLIGSFGLRTSLYSSSSRLPEKKYLPTRKSEAESRKAMTSPSSKSQACGSNSEGMLRLEIPLFDTLCREIPSFNGRHLNLLA